MKNNEYLSKEYNNLKRFVSYYHQIKSIVDLKPESILEIGIGSGIIYDYFKRAGFDITSCDIDGSLGSDYVGDIRRLPFKDKKFDVVVAFEVLEHVHFYDLERALMELKRVARRNVIISVPYAHLSLKGLLDFRLPFTGKQIVIPRFWVRFVRGKYDKEHYWELGTRGCSKRKIRNIIRKYFNVKKEFHALLNPYHYFFVLEKLGDK